jgi:hypothetical protein
MWKSIRTVILLAMFMSTLAALLGKGSAPALVLLVTYVVTVSVYLLISYVVRKVVS